MEKCLLLGNGGREAVIAENISKKYSLYSVLPYENPSIVEYIENSNGKYIIGSPFDKELVKKFILDEGIEVCVISSDNLLQEGLIDLAKELGLKTFGPTSKGAKLEWSKTYALEIVEELAPEMVIKNFHVSSEEELERAMDNYDNQNFVIKPEGLTGGKGVKIGGEHFKTKEDGVNYAKECLATSGKVIIQDKVKGREFTVMVLTDGKNVVPLPITFDYPYRFEEDKGPGTGGMGCISFSNGLLPFLNQEDVDKCVDLIQRTIKFVNRDSKEFTGVLYGGFFKTEDGIKFIEFNARFGDPEAMNALNLFETPFTNILEYIFDEKLTKEKCKFKKTNTLLVYIVSKDYAIKKNDIPVVFKVDKKAIRKAGVKIYFANAKEIEENKFTSVSNSRLFALISEGEDFEEVRKKVYEVAEKHVDNVLDYRKDIGTIYEH
ncbi:MAG: phosphoribosylamine--glycine ligase [Clostridia bacterium]|nr:phosphoribosylamine--glycine ligase [Clostridia bacterium]